ncbi:acetoacetate decarboxylase family protein [Candidatus Bipolaricaulota bacterium]
MASSEFFREIEHREVPWGQRSVHVPVFYQDAATIGSLFPASLEGIRMLLPSSRMHPIRVAPRRCLLAITCHEFRESDIGPYNEVAVTIPFTLDTPAPLLRTLFGRPNGELKAFVHQLPVTTEIARDLGVEFAGYPKFLAQITYEEDDDKRTCGLMESGQQILSLSCRKLGLQVAPRSRTHAFTIRSGMLLRSEMIVSERKLAGSRKAADVQLEFGDHPIAQELKSLDIGRAIGFSYAPSYQIILTPVIESFQL